MCDTITVYVDILLFVNLIVNGAILFVSARLIGGKLDFRRFVFADAAASGYGLIVCLPAFGFMFGILAKTAAALGICALAFKFRSFRGLLKNTCVFMACSLSYVALTVSLQSLPFVSAAVYVCNNEIYYNLPVPVLLIAALMLLLFMTVFGRVVAGRRKADRFCSVVLTLDGAIAQLDCFRDTGNMLKDPISGSPVIIAERNAVSALVSDEKKLMTRVRCIPYRTADGGSGIMKAYRPDSAMLDGNSVRLLVAVSDTPLGENFNAVIGDI